MLDRDVIDVLNETMPIALLRRVAASTALPPSVRQALTLSVFTRSLLVEQWDVARAMLPEVARVAPSLATALAALDTPDDGRLRDEAALLLLRAPGLRPYIPAWGFRDAWSDYRKVDGLTELNGLRDNWWCAFRRRAWTDRVLHADAAARQRARLATPGRLYADPQSCRRRRF